MRAGLLAEYPVAEEACQFLDDLDAGAEEEVDSDLDGDFVFSLAMVYRYWLNVCWMIAAVRISSSNSGGSP